MDIRKVKKLIELLTESGIEEIEISEGEESVRISRYARGAPAGAASSTPVTGAAAAAPVATEAVTPDPRYRVGGHYDGGPIWEKELID